MNDFADEMLRILKWVGLGVAFVVLSLAVAVGVVMGGRLLGERHCGPTCPCRQEITPPAKPRGALPIGDAAPNPKETS